MAQSAYLATVAIQDSAVLDAPRHSALVRITHWINAASFIALVVSGIGILLSHPRFYWGETGGVGSPSLFDLPLSFMLGGPSGWGRYLHFLAAWVCVLTGLLYAISGLFTQHFRHNLLPKKSDLALEPILRVASNHLHLKAPSECPAANFLPHSSFPVVPLHDRLRLRHVAGDRLGVPGIRDRLWRPPDGPHAAFLGCKSSRAIPARSHGDGYSCRFHKAHARHDHRPRLRQKAAAMSDKLSRRKLITTGLASAAGVSGLAVAAKLAGHYGLVAPDHNGILGIGESLTYGAQRILLSSSHSRAREFNRSEISKVIPVSGPAPETDPFRRHLAEKFAGWRLTVDGLVAHPASFSVHDLKRFPEQSNITHQACEEGWSFIAEWTGVPLSYVLNPVAVRPQAKWVVVYPFDTFWDSIDMSDALHPQTTLAYAMNGQDLPTDHGAPLRLRIPRQLGYKSVKYLSRITLTDSLKHLGDGRGSAQPGYGYSWFAGI
jgi:DMSO/TMAO reductase YedYZ molybdopterin-dependent catalytic subunit